MYDLTLSERFALLALNAKMSNHGSTAKKAVIRTLAVGIYIEEKLIKEPGYNKFNRTELKIVIKKSKLKKIENKVVEKLKDKGLIGEIKSLIGCDLFYDENIRIREYISDEKAFEHELGFLKAEFLEKGQITDESIILMWLIKESLSLYDLFSTIEIQKIAIRMSELASSNEIAKLLYPLDIQTIWSEFVKGFLQMKSNLFATAFGRGVAYIFPVLERKESIFIDTVEFLPSPEQRLEDVLKRVASQGHSCQVLRSGSVPLVKIDNVKYELVPDAVVVKIPIHGVRLRRYE